MRQAAVIGIGPDAFWRMTPRWLLPLLDAHHEERVGNMRFEMTKAWLTAAWPRMKRMPDLSRVLDQLGLGDKKAAQTPDEMFAAAKQWAGDVAKAHENGAAPKSTKRARLPSLERWRAAQGKEAGEQ